MIRLETVTKIYAETLSVDNLSMQIAPGDFLWIAWSQRSREDDYYTYDYRFNQSDQRENNGKRLSCPPQRNEV
jgi:hypothetical protein